MLHIATDVNDLILDSFLGSGTTAAVAHKMGRRWIGIEMGDHAVTHCLPRLQKVIAGEQGGVSEAVGWQGGGGFRFLRLGEEMFDAEGRLRSSVQFASLAAHVWMHETKQAATQRFDGPRLGEHDGIAYYLLYNGVLGDRRPASGNVLTTPVLQHIESLGPQDGRRIVYAEACPIGPARLAQARIEFRQIPYALKAR